MSPSGFVDIHSHVLYGLDDGAGTREESLAMLAIAADSGTSDLIATPHANSHYAFDPTAIADRIAELSPLTSVRLYSGCDFHLKFDNIEDALAHPDKYTLNHKGYLLVEFPETGVFTETDAILKRLLDGGLVPIVSHPERNHRLQRHLEDLARWIATGCYVQVTAGSLTGVFGRAARTAAAAMLARGLVHFVASDAHNTGRRTTSLREAYASLADEWGEDLVRPLFVENPAAVLQGKTVEFEFPATEGSPKKWYHFWR